MGHCERFDILMEQLTVEGCDETAGARELLLLHAEHFSA